VAAPPKRTAPRGATAKAAKARIDSAWRLFLPFALFGMAAITAAAHRLLGEPLGPAATAKLADLWQTLAAMVVVYSPVLGHYHRQRSLEDNAATVLPLAEARPRDEDPHR